VAYLEWNPCYDTGVASIDCEHRRLVALLNEIHGLLLSGAEPHKIAGTLGDFHARAAAHSPSKKRSCLSSSIRA